MKKRIMNLVDCVFVGEVFGGQWRGVEEVQVEKEEKDSLGKRIMTFWYKGNQYTSPVTQRPTWVFE
jgi:hypothetical protein